MRLIIPARGKNIVWKSIVNFLAVLTGLGREGGTEEQCQIGPHFTLTSLEYLKNLCRAQGELLISIFRYKTFLKLTVYSLLIFRFQS